MECCSLLESLHFTLQDDTWMESVPRYYMRYNHPFNQIPYRIIIIVSHGCLGIVQHPVGSGGQRQGTVRIERTTSGSRAATRERGTLVLWSMKRANNARLIVTNWIAVLPHFLHPIESNSLVVVSLQSPVIDLEHRPNRHFGCPDVPFSHSKAINL